MNTPGGLSPASVRTFLLGLLAALAAALVTVACGQSGPLYLPQPEPQAEPQSEPTSESGQPAPATQPGDPAEEDLEEESGEQK